MGSQLRLRMHQDLQLAGLAEGTQALYVRAIRKLAAYYKTPPDRLTEQQVRDYLLYLKNHPRKYSASSLKIAAAGITFFYTHTVPRDWRARISARCLSKCSTCCSIIP